MKESDIEQLLKAARAAREFEDELALAPCKRESSLARLGPHTQRSVVAFRWVASALAACIVVAVTVILWQSRTTVRPADSGPAPVIARGNAAGGAPSADKLPAQSPGHLVGAPITEDQVHVVVALYRNDTNVNENCPECWCVARWSAQWSDGRSIYEVQDDELVGASMAHACVLDPKQVVVVGLSGPASSMPASDQQALDLSLCLMGEVPATPQNCVPAGVDYCMASWNTR